MTRPSGSSPSNVLLVEGPDDKHVAEHIWWRCQNAEPTFCALEKDGVDKLLDAIDTEIQAPGLQAMGILVDANDDVDARWEAVKGRLASAKVALPNSPDPAGTIIAERTHAGIPRVGVWLMPDNRCKGELENFVAQMIPASDAVWPLSRDYIEGIPTTERKFIEKKKLRAQVHAWLAAREDPRRMGEAIRTRDLEIDGPLCQKFVAWLQKLFR